MRTLNLNLTDAEYRLLGQPETSLTLEQLRRRLAAAEMASLLAEVQAAAAEAGLDQMTEEEIEAESRAVREG